MKITILIIGLILSTLKCAVAQVGAHDWVFGTDLGTANYKFGTDYQNFFGGNKETSSEKNYSVSISPSVGYFISDRFDIGIDISLSYIVDITNITNTSVAPLNDYTKTVQQNASAGPFIRYYFLPESYTNPSAIIAHSTLFYAEAVITSGVASGTTHNAYANNDSVSVSGNSKLSRIIIANGSLSFGATHFIRRNIGLDISAGYTFDYEQYTNNSTTVIDNNGKPIHQAGGFREATHAGGITINAGFRLFFED